MTSEFMNTPDIEEDGDGQDIICSNCSAVQLAVSKFCTECGHEVKIKVVEKRSRRRRQPPGMAKKKKEARNNEAQVKSGRNAILSVAIFILIYYYIFDSSAATIRSNPEMWLNEEAVEDGLMSLQMVSYALLGTGFGYFGLFFWSFKNPFFALIIALAVYILIFGASLVLFGLPHFLLLIIEVMMVSYLVIGLKGCLKIRAQDE